MGRLMTLKKPKNKNKAVQITKTEVNSLIRSVKQAEQELKFETIMKSALLFIAYAMEEEVINRDPKKIVAMYDKLIDWAEHVENHTISIHTVVDIINEAAGEEIVRWEV